MTLCRVHGVGRVLVVIAACVALGACASTPSASPPSTASVTPAPISPTTTATPTVAIAPPSTPKAAGDAIYWALDRGPDGTPDHERLRVYVFGVFDLTGPVKLLAPDGSVAGIAPVMGSGMFSAASCVSRVSWTAASGLIPIGIVEMPEAAQAAFLARPAAYRAEVDRQRTPGAGSVVVRLIDSGCRPT